MFDYDAILGKTGDSLKRTITWQTAGTKPYGKILFGCGLAKAVGDEAAKLGKEKALVVTDKTVVDLKVADVVVRSLEASGFKVVVFSDVEPEPRIEVADAAAEVARKGSYGVVIGLGGGSAIDTSKAAAIAAGNPGPILDYVTGKPFEAPGLPKILIPTTSGTGSEVSNSFVFSKDGKKVFAGHAMLFADVALIDPILTSTMPPAITAGTGLDALCHAVEGLIHPKAYTMGDALSAKSIELVFKYLPRATKNGGDIEARYYMSWASSLGMMSYNWTGGLYAHSVSYVLTHFLKAGHGFGCGISLPYTLMFDIDLVRDKLKYMAKAIGVPEAVGDAPMAAIRRSWELLAEVGLPQGLKEMGVERSAIELYARELIEKYYRPFNPRPMNLEQAVQLFESMWDGQLRPIA
ncbi:MAG: iron-containing alcohol dehydrogenase [Firmicutes bacterium]|nr:iron-containing alcohol dehydrogenase [Bacillota bacterium]